MFLYRTRKKIIAKYFKSNKNKFEKISYSQCGEDIIVKYIFDVLGIEKPSYIDIGAHHPYYISNTALFYKNGSRGINIEPDPTLFKEFLEYRKEDVNLNIGVSNTRGELDFYIISSPTLSTFSKNEADKYALEGDYKIERIEKVKVFTLKDIIKDFSKGVFPQFLSIDAEGVDELIIRELDFNGNTPMVICVETISFSMNGNGIKNLELIELITSKGYLMYADTNINTIFVKKEIWQR